MPKPLKYVSIGRVLAALAWRALRASLPGSIPPAAE